MAYLGLGSNIGDREATLRAAIAALESRGLKVVQQSPVYETAPVGYLDQPPFLNQVVAVDTSLDASSLLTILLDVERSLGRVRTIRNGPRTIDLDILLFGDTILQQPDLTIPHPRMLDRRFVLEPLAAIAPDLLHPSTGRTVQHHLQILVDKETN